MEEKKDSPKWDCFTGCLLASIGLIFSFVSSFTDLCYIDACGKNSMPCSFSPQVCRDYKCNESRCIDLKTLNCDPGFDKYSALCFFGWVVTVLLYFMALVGFVIALSKCLKRRQNNENYQVLSEL